MLQRVRRCLGPALALLLLPAACGSSDDPATPDAAVSGIDAASQPMIDAAPAIDAEVFIDAEPGSVATLMGTVTRSTAPVNGGVGNLYIAIFEEDPIANMQQSPVAQALLENVDMTAADAAIAYEVIDVPVRPQPYFVVAFLDDNGTVDAGDPGSAGPDKGDLISLMGIATPQVKIDAVGTVEHDIDLNLAFPF